MPLSEEELRMLQQMERALVEEDPKFASTLRGTSLRQAARSRAVLAGVVFVLGVALLMTGAVARITLVGIAGFLVMLASATVAVTALRGGSGQPQKGPGADGDGGFRHRFERRWPRRGDHSG